jgi:hypothetical protein
VTIDEFLDFNAYTSMAIESDAFFDLVMMSTWSDPKRSSENLPFAGSQRKVTAINARDAYRNDHHRNLFGTDSQTPFEKKAQVEWGTTTQGSYKESDLSMQVPMAGGGANASSGVN